MDLADIVGTVAQSGIGNGFAKAGADLGAGGIGEGQILAAMGQGGAGGDPYTRGANAGMDLLKKRLEARKLRDEAVARDRTLQKMTAAFPDMDPAMVDMMANTMIGGLGSDFSSTMTGAKNAQEMDLQRRAAAASDPAIRNQILAAMHGQPQDLTKISSGTAYNPTVTPGEQTMVVTPDAAADNVRQELVAASQAQRNLASAENYGARTASYQDTGARKIAQREAQNIADEARMSGMKISKAQERQVAEAMLSGSEWSLRDESVQKGMTLSKTSTPGGDFAGRVQFKGGDTSVANANPGRGPAAVSTGMSSPVQTDGNIAAPKNKTEYDALPSGARYRAPDGSVKVKR